MEILYVRITDALFMLTVDSTLGVDSICCERIQASIPPEPMSVVAHEIRREQLPDDTYMYTYICLYVFVSTDRGFIQLI